jgi:hypothetical protein
VVTSELLREPAKQSAISDHTHPLGYRGALPTISVALARPPPIIAAYTASIRISSCSDGSLLARAWPLTSALLRGSADHRRASKPQRFPGIAKDSVTISVTKTE